MVMVNSRTDPQRDAALAFLTQDGSTVSAVIPKALTDAVRGQGREQMRRESMAARHDPVEIEQMPAELADLDDLWAW